MINQCQTYKNECCPTNVKSIKSNVVVFCNGGMTPIDDDLEINSRDETVVCASYHMTNLTVREI